MSLFDALLIISAVYLCGVLSQQCLDCQNNVPTQGCPNPGACGYASIPCIDCMPMYMPECPDWHLCESVGCYNCMDGMPMDGCTNPGACGFQALPCTNCPLGVSSCPNATLCMQVGCYNCSNALSTAGCPNPGACGYTPIPCSDCMQGMPMDGCPNPNACGVWPSGPPGDMQCTGCMAGMAMAQCPDPLACGYCIMANTFYTSKEVCLWFSSWNITTGGEYFGAVCLLVFLAFIREWVTEARVLSAVRRRQRQRREAGRSDTYEAMADPTSSASSEPTSSFAHGAIWDVSYYFISLTLGYFLMLAVMIYNFGLTVTVIVGSAVGRFLTPWVIGYCFKKKA